jgi:hypothetical protein
LEKYAKIFNFEKNIFFPRTLVTFRFKFTGPGRLMFFDKKYRRSFMLKEGFISIRRHFKVKFKKSLPKFISRNMSSLNFIFKKFIKLVFLHIFTAITVNFVFKLFLTEKNGKLADAEASLYFLRRSRGLPNFFFRCW